MAATSLLNTSAVIKFSNWPICDGYTSAMNVPAPPASTPKTGTSHSSLHMSFVERVVNLFFHMLIALGRALIDKRVEWAFAQEWKVTTVSFARRAVWSLQSHI